MDGRFSVRKKFGKASSHYRKERLAVSRRSIDICKAWDDAKWGSFRQSYRAFAVNLYIRHLLQLIMEIKVAH